MPRTRCVVFVLASSLFVAAGLSPVDGRDVDLSSLQAEVLQTLQRVRPAVVHISGSGSSFSGVIVSVDGHVLSAGHAVSPGARYRIELPDGRRLRGVGKGSNPRADAALILINDPPDNLPYVSMGDSASLVTDQPCFGLSYPGGPKAGSEPVARFGRVIRSRSSRGMLQTSVLMEPGDSGGPLFDLSGCVIGIHSRIGRSMERNYEVPINLFREYWNELNREQTFTQAGPPVPQLGIRFERFRQAAEDGPGLKIIGVLEESLASTAALQTDDRLLEVSGQAVGSQTDLQQALIAARDEGAKAITLKLQRGEETLEREIAFDVERETAPEVPLPVNDRPEVPVPQSVPQLRTLSSVMAELEDQLDDSCLTIESRFGETTRTITGTCVAETPWILSKSSAVGDTPTTTLNGEACSLTVIARDAANDLVLLRSPAPHQSGIVVDQAVADLPVGSFVLSPDDDGPGVVSVIGSPVFASPKQQSRGFLGVMPSTYGSNEGARLEQVTEAGAAEKAGLLVGDIITRLNDTVIRSQGELRNFLASLDPGAVIEATLQREDDELTMSVTLGSFPEQSNHAADQIAKSGRRDGFTDIFPHDADLSPDDCGGPLFDLEGRFVGLNIARHSRTRSFTLPASVVTEWLEKAGEGRLSDAEID